MLGIVEDLTDAGVNIYFQSQAMSTMKADGWPKRHISVEQMRAQSQRNHEAVMAGKEKDLSLSKK